MFFLSNKRADRQVRENSSPFFLRSYRQRSSLNVDGFNRVFFILSRTIIGSIQLINSRIRNFVGNREVFFLCLEKKKKMFFNGKFVWILFIDFLRFRSDSSIEIINVAAFFNEKPDDEKALRGAELAVEHLNRWSEDLFDGRYKINLFVNNSQVSSSFRSNRLQEKRIFFAFSAIRFLRSTLFSTRFFVVRKYFSFSELRVRTKRNRSSKWLNITI